MRVICNVVAAPRYHKDVHSNRQVLALQKRSCYQIRLLNKVDLLLHPPQGSSEESVGCALACDSKPLPRAGDFVGACSCRVWAGCDASAVVLDMQSVCDVREDNAVTRRMSRAVDVLGQTPPAVLPKPSQWSRGVLPTCSTCSTRLVCRISSLLLSKQSAGPTDRPLQSTPRYRCRSLGFGVRALGRVSKGAVQRKGVQHHGTCPLFRDNHRCEPEDLDAMRGCSTGYSG